MSKRLEPGYVFHERYQIVAELGAGGMAVVYEVRDMNTQRHRALKLLLPTFVEIEDVRRRFRQEAIVAANIESEHIVETVDAGIDGETGTPFLLLELLRGQPLDQLLEQKGQLSQDEALIYLEQTAYGLDKAHAANVVHRDLKPDNLFVTYRDDGSPHVKILDFGIAKIIATTVSVQQTVGILGTPLYMAPEQIHTDFDITPRTDVFALGHVAYTLLVGESYWAAEQRAATTVYKLLLEVSEGAKQKPSERALERCQIHLPPAFDAWFDVITAEHPDQRFEAASTAIRALRTALESAPQRTAPQPASPPPVQPSVPAPPTMPEQNLVNAQPANAQPANAQPANAPIHLPMETIRLPEFALDAEGGAPGSVPIENAADANAAPHRTLVSGAQPTNAPSSEIQPARSRLGLVLFALLLIAVAGLVAVWAVATYV